MTRMSRFSAVLFIAGLTAACQHQNPELVLSKKSPVELRAIQSRAFDTQDQVKTLRTIVVTMQDLGYSLEKVEPKAGTVTGSKLGVLKLTASCYPRNTQQLVVRANAIVTVQNPRGQALSSSQVDAPEFYQKLFFEPLAKAMFLEALAVQDDQPATPPPQAEASDPSAPKP